MTEFPMSRGYTQARRERALLVSATAELGIIGGSGLYALDGFEASEELTIPTPYGDPSDRVRIGTLEGRAVAFISRHGPGHRLAPSEVPYAANIYALKSLGVTHVLSVSAVGSLKEEIPPRSFVVPSDLIDRTISRRRSFFGDGIVAHASMADPFCPAFGDVLAAVAGESAPLPVSRGGSYVCIEGPQFSTRAESELFRTWGASIIGMTALPEARLAREAELCYACLAMVSDYDVWHESDDVSVELVIANLHAMTSAVAAIIPALAARLPIECNSGCGRALDNAIITAPDAWPDGIEERLGPVGGRVLEARGRG